LKSAWITSPFLLDYFDAFPKNDYSVCSLKGIIGLDRQYSVVPVPLYILMTLFRIRKIFEDKTIILKG